MALNKLIPKSKKAKISSQNLIPLAPRRPRPRTQSVIRQASVFKGFKRASLHLISKACRCHTILCSRCKVLNSG